MSDNAALEKYFEEAASWDANRAAQLERSERRGWIVAASSCLCTMLMGAALVLLVPLKRVDPFVVRVDNSTGVVDVVPTYTGSQNMPEAVTRYFLDHYVTVCERFNHGTAESDYEECGAFHTAQRNQAWYAAWNRGNPGSPLNVYKDGTSIRAQVSSISFFTRANGVSDLAQIRYVKKKRSGDGAKEQRTYWIGTIQFSYTKPSADPKQRRWNPLGFRVIDFRPEPETLTEVEEAAAQRVTLSGLQSAEPQS